MAYNHNKYGRIQFYKIQNKCTHSLKYHPLYKYEMNMWAIFSWDGLSNHIKFTVQLWIINIANSRLLTISVHRQSRLNLTSARITASTIIMMSATTSKAWNFLSKMRNTSINYTSSFSTAEILRTENDLKFHP